jgi:predicted aconitase with swiveling domain
MVVVRRLTGEMIVPGHAAGPCLTSDDALSFWGGIDPDTGEVIDRHHSLSGQCVTRKVLVLPHGRGSCSGSGVFLEAIRNQTAPAAILVLRSDPIFALGSILGELLYERPVPVVRLDAGDHAALASEEYVEIAADGSITVYAAPSPTALTGG